MRCERFDSPMLISDHLFPDWFMESILPVNHRRVKWNASQWLRNVGREGAEMEGAFLTLY